MIDFHCHLDLYPAPLDVAREASRKNEFTLAVTTSPKAWLATSRVFQPLPNIKIALGLHPEIVEKKASEHELLLELTAKADFIGETGLDGSPQYRSSFQLQVAILDSLLRECSAHGGRIISLHSRGAVNEVLDLLDKHPESGTPVLHWFSGSKSELARAVDRGCWFSFGPGGLASKSGRNILRAIPMRRLLPESDGPFAHCGGAVVMPWEAHAIVSEISELRGLSQESVEHQFRANLTEILRINKKT